MLVHSGLVWSIRHSCLGLCLWLSLWFLLGISGALGLLDLCRYSCNFLTSCIPSTALVTSMATTSVHSHRATPCFMFESDQFLDTYGSPSSLRPRSALFHTRRLTPTPFQFYFLGFFLLHCFAALSDHSNLCWVPLLLLFRLDTLGFRNGNPDHLRRILCFVWIFSNLVWVDV